MASVLFVHCGTQRTGTSTLQACLAARRDELLAVGVDYPRRWCPRGSDAHYGVADMLEPSAGRDAAIAEFREYLSNRTVADILLSSESLATWLSDEKQPALIRLLHAAQRELPVTCIWTLRSADQFLTSMYLHQLMFGYQVPPPREYFLDGAHRVAAGLAALRSVELALGEEFVYLKYAPDGGHSAAILLRVGLPAGLRDAILADLGRVRLNPGLSRKAAAAMLHSEAISERAETQIHRATLKELFYRSAFRFAEDEPCVLVDDAVRHHVHGTALEAANAAGFAPYVEFFQDHEVESASPTPIDADALTDGDVAALVGRLRSGRRA